MKKQHNSRITNYLRCAFYGFLFLSILFLSSCGYDDTADYDANNNSETGSFSCTLKWPDDIYVGDYTLNTSRQITIDFCEAQGIDVVLFAFYDSGGDLLVGSSLTNPSIFNCESRYGRVDGIPLGNCEVMITAEDAYGTIKYWVEPFSISIVAGQTATPDNGVAHFTQFAPKNVIATAEDEQVTISWDPVAGLASYNIYWSTYPGVSKVDYEDVISDATNPYPHTGLSNGTTYYYVVTAENSQGESAESSEVNATPFGPPPPPSNVNTTAEDEQVTISWDSVVDATSYNIYWSTSSGVTKETGTEIPGITTTSYPHTGLTSGTTYYYVVTAANSQGESDESDEVYATPLPPTVTLSAPTNVIATAGNEQVTISWNSVADATSYNIYWSTNSGVTKETGTEIPGITTTSYPHMGLTNGTTYYYVVTAANSQGESDESSEVDETPFEISMSVAIIGAANNIRMDDVTAKLLNTGYFLSVTQIDARTVTPTLSELQSYHAVLVFSNESFADAVALGDVLADYVDSGGGVVCAVFTTASIPIQGRFNTDNYYAIPPLDQTQGVVRTLAPIITDHFILNGVNSFNGGTNSYTGTSTVIAPDATLIAEWDDGLPLIASKEINGIRRVDLNFYPPSSDSRDDFWDSATDGDLIMANALRWVATYPGPGPDLGVAITDVVSDGSDVTVFYTVYNNGNEDAGPFYVDVWPDLASPPSIGDFGPGWTYYSGGLLARDSLSDSIVISSVVQSGTAYATVDSEFEVAESNEDNNVSAAYSWMRGDDNYEENDTLATAYDLSYDERTNLSTLDGPGVQADDDWYEISVTSGYERVQVVCLFADADGNIDIQLVNASGTVLASAGSMTDNEFIDHVVPSAGTYYIRVYYGNAGNTYDLWWDDILMPTNGLVAYYPFNGNANDASGNGHDGTNNGAALTADRSGNADSAYYFNGAESDYIGIPDHAGLNFGTGDFSVSFWIKCTGTIQTGGFDISFIDKRVSEVNGWTIKARSDSYLALQTVDPINSWEQTFGTTAINNDVWHHIVAIRTSAGNKIVYIDNNVELNYTTTVRDVSSTKDLEFGRLIASDLDENYYIGTLDDVAIYNRALTPSEVQQLFQAP
jgi:hypothetical protein